MPTMPEGYYNRFNPTLNYDAHLFRAGSVLQSAELNEVQSAIVSRLQRIGDAIFKDGDLVRDAKLIINISTGIATGESGAIYLKGAVRGIPARQFPIPLTGTVVVGIYLTEVVITELEDPTLRDPAIGVRNYMEPGASRLQANPQWGYAGEPGAPSAAEFYPIYTVIDGVPLPKVAPPSNESTLQALAAYDRQSAGGYYVVNGLAVSALADLPDGSQVYSIQEGTARIDGREVTLINALRVIYPATPDLAVITGEPHSATASPQTLTPNHGPVDHFNYAQITAEKTVTVTHGAYSGVLDALPDTSIMTLQSVTQGATTYVQGSDYKLTSDKVDWSLVGAEPSPGSTYTVTYRYIAQVALTGTTGTSGIVTGAVTGSTIFLSYVYRLPRIDRLSLTVEGLPVWTQGLPHPYRPALPYTPIKTLSLALVAQNWTLPRTVTQNAVKVVPMDDLNQIQTQISALYALIADQRLLNNVVATVPTTKKGVFVDPFLDDDMRDAGLAQTAVILDGDLTLGATVHIDTQRLPAQVGYAGIATATLALPMAAPAVSINQAAITDTRAVNPYAAFTPIPAGVVLTPAVDLWSDEVNTLKPATTALVITGDPGLSASALAAANQWISWFVNTGQRTTRQDTALKQWIDMHRGGNYTISTQQTTNVLSSTDRMVMNLRQITVQFALSGFFPGEVLASILFDGVSVTFTA